MSNLYYRNPRLLVLTIGVIVVAGLTSFQVMPRLEDPKLTNRFATVKTVFPGADAERVEALVTEKLEKKIREIEEIKLIESQSRVGISTMTIELRDDVVQVDEVWSRVRDQVGDAAAQLPAEALAPEFEVSKVGAYAMILAVTWTESDEPNFAILRRQAEDLAQVLRGVSGTEEADLFGDPTEEILVQVRPDLLASLGLRLDQVAQCLQASDAKLSAGRYRSSESTLLMEVASDLDSLERIGRTPLRVADGSRVVPLGSLADVSKGIRTPPDSLAVIGGRPAVVVAARVQGSARIDRWSASAWEAVNRFEAGLPDIVRIESVFDQSGYVAARMDDLLRNLVFGCLGVLAVMLVMMGWRSALIVGVSLPLASLMALTGLRWLNVPIQQMSVTGLVIALGLLIDNAIVVVDEVRQRLREGRSPADAVGGAARHLAVPLFSSSLTTALAFAPIALMPGAAGEFVGAIAVSVILAIFSSLLLSLTVVAALAAMGTASHRTVGCHWWQTGISLPRGEQFMAKTLEPCLRRPVRAIVLVAVVPLTGFVAAPTLREQFFPPEERNQFQIELELPVHASLAQTMSAIRRAREVVLGHPEVERVDWFLGESAPAFYYNVLATRDNSSQYAQAIVTTRGRLLDKQLLNALQFELDAQVPEGRVLVRQLEQGPPFEAPVEVRITGPDLDGLREAGHAVRSILADVPCVTHTVADLSDAMPKLLWHVDEEAARFAGLDHASVSRQLEDLLEGVIGGSVLEATEELPVRLRVSGERRGSLDFIASLDLVSANPPGVGGSVPVQAVADVCLAAAPALIARRDGNRVNNVKAYTLAGILPSQVLADFQQRLERSGFVLPPGYALAYGGEAAERDDAVRNLMASVAPLLVVMVASLVLAFGSFRLAALIGGVGFLSVGLSLLMLWLFGYPFGFMAIIGTMGLVGVAINDSIVVLAALRDDVHARLGHPDAIIRVVLRSTRHVFATSFTTLAGFAPLFLFGGVFWEPLAITIAGGVAGATLLALVFVPSAYVLIARRQLTKVCDCVPIGGIQPMLADPLQQCITP